MLVPLTDRVRPVNAGTPSESFILLSASLGVKVRGGCLPAGSTRRLAEESPGNSGQRVTHANRAPESDVRENIFENSLPAVTYFPTQSPKQYRRR